MYETGVSNAVMVTMISAISKYHITNGNTDLTVGKYLLVISSMKAFLQLKPPLLKYLATFNARIILRFIENQGENKTLTPRHLSLRTVFLVMFLTLSRCCFVPAINSTNRTQIR